MIEGILIGLKTALSFQNLLMVMIGCFAGTIIGMLPGLGPMTAIALMIPITYGFDPATGLILMAGVYYGAVFGGSTSFGVGPYWATVASYLQEELDSLKIKTTRKTSCIKSHLPTIFLTSNIMINLYLKP